MYNASHDINIHTKNQELTFNEGKYHVDVLGGWNVGKNGFNLKLINKETNAIVFSSKPWPLQILYGFKREKRIFTFQDPEKGIYILDFVNSEFMVVKASLSWHRNLLFNGNLDN